VLPKIGHTLSASYKLSWLALQKLEPESRDSDQQVECQNTSKLKCNITTLDDELSQCLESVEDKSGDKSDNLVPDGSPRPMPADRSNGDPGQYLVL
jgi:hypothetical protein